MINIVQLYDEELGIKTNMKVVDEKSKGIV
jgi:hypothetical protein